MFQFLTNFFKKKEVIVNDDLGSVEDIGDQNSLLFEDWRMFTKEYPHRIVCDGCKRPVSIWFQKWTEPTKLCRACFEEKVLKPKFDRIKEERDKARNELWLNRMVLQEKNEKIKKLEKGETK